MYNLAATIGIIALYALHLISIPKCLTVVSFMILFVMSLTVRRVLFKRYIELGEDALLLPTGFFHRHTARIPYTAIHQVWESRWIFGTVLYLRTEQRKYEILCGLLLNIDDCLAVRKFLTAVVSNGSVNFLYFYCLIFQTVKML